MTGVPEREFIRVHDEYEEWIRVFESIVQLLDDYEQYRHKTSNVSARENIAIRIESVIVLLQQEIVCTIGINESATASRVNTSIGILFIKLCPLSPSLFIGHGIVAYISRPLSQSKL